MTVTVSQNPDRSYTLTGCSGAIAYLYQRDRAMLGPHDLPWELRVASASGRSPTFA